MACARKCDICGKYYDASEIDPYICAPFGSNTSLDTSKLHYVKVPENHIVIDFDIRDASGNKSFQKNLEAAEKW